MALALDEPRENDKTETIDGLCFVVDKNLLENVQPIKIDFTPFGFKIDCDFDFKTECSACGTTCSR
jgi:hypothetical protein